MIITTAWAREGGHVRSSGELYAGPAGWSAERVAQGDYVVRHGIGHDNYSVHVQALVMESQAPAIAAVTEEKGDHFTFKIFALDGSPADHDAQFLVSIS